MSATSHSIENLDSMCSGAQNDVTQAQSGATHLKKFSAKVQKYHFRLTNCYTAFSASILYTEIPIY